MSSLIQLAMANTENFLQIIDELSPSIVIINPSKNGLIHIQLDEHSQARASDCLADTSDADSVFLFSFLFFFIACAIYKWEVTFVSYVFIIVPNTK